MPKTAPHKGKGLEMSGEQFQMLLDGFHRNNVLLEEIRAQNRATIEAVHSEVGLLRREMNERFERVEVRLDVLEAVVRQHSKDIQELKRDVAELKGDVAELKRDVAELKREVTDIRRILVRDEKHLARLDEGQVRQGEYADELRIHRGELVDLRKRVETLEAAIKISDV